MTATTFDDTTTVQGAPRRMVEDAWRSLNRRYAIGAGVLLAALLLLWAIGMGPGASRTGAPGSSAMPGAMDSPGSASSRNATGASTTVPPTMAGGATGTSGAAANGDGKSGSGGSAVSNSSTGSTGATGLKDAASGGSGTSAAGNGASASGNGTATAATPRTVPGAPVARLYFEPDQAWPTGEVGPRLAPVLARLKAEPDTKALVSGFHDRRGSAEANAALALRRAQVVRRVLIREGIAADRIALAKPQQMQGSGPDREARRVEVTVAR